MPDLYGVPSDNILYIHGEAGEIGSELVLGHAWTPDERTSLRSDVDGESEDHRVLEALDTLDEYFGKTYKPSKLIISENAGLFGALVAVEEVVVLGHSLSSVDNEYFLAVVKAFGTRTVDWTIVARSHEKDRERIKCLIDLGVSPTRVCCKLWSELWSGKW